MSPSVRPLRRASFKRQIIGVFVLLTLWMNRA